MYFLGENFVINFQDIINMMLLSLKVWSYLRMFQPEK